MSADFGLVGGSGIRIKTAPANKLAIRWRNLPGTRGTTLKESFRWIDRLVEATSVDRDGVRAFFGVPRVRILHDLLGGLSGRIRDG